MDNIDINEIIQHVHMLLAASFMANRARQYLWQI